MKLSRAFAFAVMLAYASGASALTRPKTYAVFYATFDSKTGHAVGGVAGSAFFVSPTHAITAAHVLQPKSFASANTQVWLVHEGERAIELSRSEVASELGFDRTTIQLTKEKAPSHLVYETSPRASPLPLKSSEEIALVETDGFAAQSTGPKLAVLPSGRLQITTVPRLERVHAEGRLLLKQTVDLTSQDVNLRGAPCLKLSYKPVIGLSGGPVVSQGRVIGMNSFADPGARLSTWAVRVD